MARCLRCKAGNEWIEGDVKPKSHPAPLTQERVREIAEQAFDNIIGKTGYEVVEDAINQALSESSPGRVSVPREPTEETLAAADEDRGVTKRIIDSLLDAAFSELQHDTGPQDKEYVYQRGVLEEKFRSLLAAAQKGE